VPSRTDRDHPDRVAALRVLVRLARMLERSSGELSLAHYRVLAAVAAGSAQASHVAARLALAKPTISASVDALCRRGLLVREDVPTDQRAATLCITPEGQRQLADVETVMLAKLDAVLARADDPHATLAAIAGLTDALDELSDERLAQRMGTAKRPGAR
jgi:DNA-binding MarR family transcriptional regulator